MLTKRVMLYYGCLKITSNCISDYILAVSFIEISRSVLDTTPTKMVFLVVTYG